MKFDRSFYTPTHTSSEEHEDVKAIVYLDDLGHGYYMACGFSGRKAKPDFHFKFDGEEARQKYINNWLDRLRHVKADKEARRQAKKEFKTSLNVGDILYTSWGYDQTNVEFYQVVDVTASGKSIKVREIAAESSDPVSHGMADHVLAIADEFISDEVLTRRVSVHDSISIKNSITAWPWGGEPKYRSWYH